MADTLSALRSLMASHSPPLDALVVPSEDYHQSEYVSERDKRREFVSGFTGSAGLALITKNEARLWTDGRYFLQATQELSDQWQLMRMGEDPTVDVWMADNLPQDSAIGIDPWCVSINTAQLWERAFARKQQKLVQTSTNLVDEVWKNQPPAEINPVIVHPLEYAGRSVADKLKYLREKIVRENARGIIISALDEVAWTYNIRGTDVAYNPVVHAFAIVTSNSAFLYVDKRKVSSEVHSYLEENGIEVRDYKAVSSDVALLASNQLKPSSTVKRTEAEKPNGGNKAEETDKDLIWADPGSCCYALYSRLNPEKVILQPSPLALAKALKNPVELEGLKKAHIRDGVAVVQYLVWLDKQAQEIYGASGFFLEGEATDKKNQAKTAKLTEVTVSDKLEGFRASKENFRGLSFPTISSVGPNAAIIHYSPEAETCAEFDPDSIYLFDSGAQYLDGTTDITRTVHFGKPSAHEKACYTAVLKGHIGLGNARFPNGTNGNMLDILARVPLWKSGLDYRHGTGHGIGSYLNVHEGPHLISFRPHARNVPLQVSMTVTDEPGYYEDGKFGIRLENVLVIKEADTKFNFGDKGYLQFEHITWAPYQRKLIDLSLLVPEELEWLNTYHSKCRDILAPYLDESDQGIEVAWNQVKLYDFLQSPEDLERLYCEIHLLKTLKHRNIMKFYTSWVDTANRNINFVTEMFTSGTLKQYRLKHKRVNIRAVKNWCRQILRGLLYLHSHDPPVIHRDLKCDNIFINGNQGEVKIGDLGLAAILRKSHSAHCVGTPEFMAPEVYEEAYNELVDIYSFGMCVLEMVTFEYPYSECTHPAQIYKKVVSGKKPEALYKVKDPELREFVEKCLATAPLRPSARELLNDPFLQIDECESDLRSLDYGTQLDDMGPLARQPLLELHQSNSSFSNGYSNGYDFDSPNEWGYQPVDIESTGIELFEHHEDDHSDDVDISIKGKRGEDGGIFLRLRITDKEGRIRNIYFPFDTENDTALSVATEMVAELDITDQDETRIANMIDGEISMLVPDWQSGPGLEETPLFANQSFCHNCVSNHTSSGSMMEYLSNHPSAKDLQALQCCKHGCPSMHGRFEEITYQADESEHHVTKGEPNESGQSDCVQYQEIWGQQQHESRELSLVDSGQSHSDEEYEKMDHLLTVEDEQDSKVENNTASEARNSIKNLSGLHSICMSPPMYHDLSDSYENGIQKDLRWFKAKHQMELRELRDEQLGIISKSLPNASKEQKIDDGFLSSLVSNTIQGINKVVLSKSCAYDHQRLTPDFHANLEKSCPNLEPQRARNCEAMESPNAANVTTGKSLYTDSLLPLSLRRTASLPVDAVDL